MAHDRSRSAFDVRQPKHYDGVLMQQGRLLSDDDWNEGDEIGREDLRHTRIDVIGASGSPDDGFKVSNARVNANQIDFDLAAGTMYAGGIRTSLEQPESFSLQTDWLQQAPADRPAVTNKQRVDLVYLELWQQPVTAVEDAELREVALGGPDTSVRMRTMRRVHVLPNAGWETCGPAWAKLVADLGALTPENERVIDATLTVAPVQNTGPATNLCSPSTQAGYLGAENQAIRVELGGTANTFLWGYDNASPLYRVQVTQDAVGAQVIHFLNAPADEVHWPVAQQVVELLPWSAIMPNGEKPAELSGGFLATVGASYDPNTQNIKVTPVVPGTFGTEWHNRTDNASISSLAQSYFYLRVWNRGGDTTSPAEIPFVPGTAVPLAGTGIEVTFGGTTFHQGDFWIIAARPESPTAVVPWKLSSGRLAEGVRRFYAPLALIHWRPVGGPHTVFDCRKTFCPLTEPCGCCLTLSPKPGWDHSLEEVATVDDVCICFQPGDYVTDRTLLLRNKNVKIHGAGGATRIVGSGVETVLLFQGCTSVEVSDLSIRAMLTVRNTATDDKPHLAGAIATANCDHVVISNVTARCASGPVKAASCISVYSAAPADRVVAPLVRIVGCELVVGANQVGLSVINYGRTTIADNSLHVDATENASLPAAWQQDKGFRRAFRRALIYRHGIGNNVTAASRNFTASTHKIWVESAQELTSIAWQTVGNWRKVPPKRVDHMTIGEFLHELAEDLIYGNGTIGTHSSAVFKSYIDKMLLLRTAATKVRGIAAQGIVVGGTTAHEVRIVGNTVRDAVQGIHVGVSAQRPRNPGAGAPIADSAGRVVIVDNAVFVTLMPESAVERHGIFVGSCTSLLIEDNHIECERLGAGARLDIEGIRVYGFLGRMLYVTRNDMTGFTTGIRVAALNNTTAAASSMWRVTENIAFGATRTTDFRTKLGGNSQVTSVGNLP